MHNKDEGLRSSRVCRAPSGPLRAFKILTPSDSAESKRVQEILKGLGCRVLGVRGHRNVPGWFGALGMLTLPGCSERYGVALMALSPEPQGFNEFWVERQFGLSWENGRAEAHLQVPGLRQQVWCLGLRQV